MLFHNRFFSMFKSFALSLISVYFILSGPVQADENILQDNTIKMESHQSDNAFPLVHDGTASTIVFDADDAPVVKIAAEALGNDIVLVTDVRPKIYKNSEKLPKSAIIIGTLEKSRFIKQLCNAKKLPADRIAGKWETFLITIVEKPFDGVDRALVIAGSDLRGTAFGVFELSKQMGVSPWYWWADVHPQKRNALFVANSTIVEGPPSVKYRGIFLNDEDWGLKPWAAENMDTDIKDIGPKTYTQNIRIASPFKSQFYMARNAPLHQGLLLLQGKSKAGRPICHRRRLQPLRADASK